MKKKFFKKILFLISKIFPFVSFTFCRSATISLTNNVPYLINNDCLKIKNINKFFLMSKKKLSQSYTQDDITSCLKKENFFDYVDTNHKIFFPTFQNYFLFFVYFYNIIFFFNKKKILIIFDNKVYNKFKSEIELVLNDYKNIKIYKIDLDGKKFIDLKNVFILKKNFLIDSKIPLQILFGAKNGVENYISKLNFKNFNNKKIKKIYLERDELADRRKIVNYSLLKNFLKKKDFYILDPSKISIINLILLMKDVEHVVMQSGSSMSALYYIKKKAKVLNIHNQTGSSDIWVEEISNFLGFDYFLYRGDNTETKKIHNLKDNSNFKIDLVKFEHCYNLFINS